MKHPFHFIRTLHLDEDGTTITEFVVVLPVFVLIFSATLALSKMQHIGIETQIRASSQMWDNALAVQTGDFQTPDETYTTASAGAVLAGNNLSTQTANADALNFMQQRWQATGTGGHMGEANFMVGRLYNNNHIDSSLGLDNYSKISTAHARYNLNTLALTDSVGDIFDPTQQRAAFQLLNDTNTLNDLPNSINLPTTMSASSYQLLLSGDPTNNPEGDIYTRALTSNSSRLALAAGFRYGNAQGFHQETVVHPMLPGAPQLSAGFTTLLAPRAAANNQDYLQTNTVSHMTLMSQQLYSTLLAVNFRESYTFDTNY
mgnify:CR=1 FL=1